MVSPSTFPHHAETSGAPVRFGMVAVGKPEPLRNIPLDITVDGVRVTGFIAHLWDNDLTVVITSHGAGRRNGRHIPYFAMYPAYRFAVCEGKRTTGITSRGQQRAESLLRELYENPGLTERDGMRAFIEP